MPQKKYTIGMDEKLMDQVDGYAQEIHISRSAALAVLCSQALEARTNMGTLQQFIKLAQSQNNLGMMGQIEETPE